MEIKVFKKITSAVEFFENEMDLQLRDLADLTLFLVQHHDDVKTYDWNFTSPTRGTFSFSTRIYITSTERVLIVALN